MITVFPHAMPELISLPTYRLHISLHSAINENPFGLWRDNEIPQFFFKHHLLDGVQLFPIKSRLPAVSSVSKVFEYYSHRLRHWLSICISEKVNTFWSWEKTAIWQEIGCGTKKLKFNRGVHLMLMSHYTKQDHFLRVLHNFGIEQKTLKMLLIVSWVTVI